VERLRWWRSDEGELGLATATVELLGAVGAQWLRARMKEGREMRNEGADRSGRVLA